MSKAITEAQTGFDIEDLTIRNRVLAYKAALDATPPMPRRDVLLTQFTREVNDLKAQLAQVETMFGSGDPMALVLREAIASAESRRDTRKLELDMEEEGEGGKSDSPAIAASMVVTRENPHQNSEFLWALLLFWSWKRDHATLDQSHACGVNGRPARTIIDIINKRMYNFVYG